MFPFGSTLDITPHPRSLRQLMLPHLSRPLPLPLSRSLDAICGAVVLALTIYKQPVVD